MNQNLQHKIHNTLVESLSKIGTPGALLGFYDQKNGEAYLGAGYCDLNQQVPIDPNGQFYIYSITKTLTAACMLKLVEENHIELDINIAKYLPNLNIDARITIRMLLNHTSGIRDYGGLHIYHDSVKRNPTVPWTFEKYKRKTIDKGLLFDPGTGWAYSNPGYMLLLKIIENVTGLTFSQAIHKYVIQPLELHDTYVAEKPDCELNLVPAYSKSLNEDNELEDIRAKYHPGWCSTGVIVSTTKDIISFYLNLFSNKLLTQSSIDEMIKMVKVPGDHPLVSDPCYGLGIMGDPGSALGNWYGHGGGGPGYNLIATFFPDCHGRKIMILAVCNTELQDHPFAIIHGVMEVLNH